MLEDFSMRLRLLNLIGIGLAVLLAAPPGAYSAGSTGITARPQAGAVMESPFGAYVVVMAQDPVIAYEGGTAGYKATKPAAGKKLNPNSARVKKYEKFLERGQATAMRAAGISHSDVTQQYSIALNGFAAKMSLEQAKAMQRAPGVAMVLPDILRQPTTDNSADFLGLTDPGGAYAKGYDGEGVVVGVIDNGIWPEHPSFADDGSYGPSPIGPLDDSRPNCEFGNTSHNAADAPFECNNKLLGARQMMDTYRALIGADPDEFDSARDDDGHGTHTASTAAGNAGVEASILGGGLGTVSGVAPRARIVMYKGLGKLGGFSSDLAAAIDQAVADGVDVINYSIGSGSQSLAADDIAFLFAADAGVFAATSAGNSGPGANTIGSPALVPWLTTVGASTQDRTFEGSASSSDGWEFFGASVTGGTGGEFPLIDAEDVGGDLCFPGTLNPAEVTGKIVLCRRGVIARVAKSQAVYDAGGVGTILYNNSDSDTENTDNHWTPTVHINNTDGLVIKGYIDSAGAAAVAQINGGEAVSIPAPWMAAFSSRGPNGGALDIIKPDITAPGVNILAGNSPVNYNDEPQGELFQAISGTSMSSPHIAGIFALIKQAHPDWSPAMAKSAVMTTAYQDVMKEDGATPADPFDMGAGHVDPGGKANKGSVFQPGLVYDAGLFEYAAYTCGANLGVFTQGSCDFLESIGVPSDPSDLNLPSIGIAELPGRQTVVRTVTSVAKENGWRKYRVSVDAPEGYEVTVSPETIRLKRGQSASYEVTITNVSAPAGEWRFGSLTWNDKTGNYSVRSPIAVRGSLFAAPAAVEGSGESGGASFDVSFGYTGSYAAAAHGLEPAIVISDNVVQDPDQNFDPNDGFSNLHQFNLSGAAYFRIKMPPEAVDDPNIDLDVFVYDPNGIQVASSTSGGTDEQVDLVLPADGTWSVFVHGWQTAGPSADYDLFAWVISATPGGNMSIDSAPTSATAGATETIEVSWSGASAGQWHLGAVSHTGDVGLMGLTLVEVDNR
jgi:subtilisin family serine protease